MKIANEICGAEFIKRFVDFPVPFVAKMNLLAELLGTPRKNGCDVLPIQTHASGRSDVLNKSH